MKRAVLIALCFTFISTSVALQRACAQAAGTEKKPRSGDSAAPRTRKRPETQPSTAKEDKQPESKVSPEKAFSFDNVKDYVSERLYFKAKFPGEVEVDKAEQPPEGSQLVAQTTFTCMLENRERFSVSVMELGEEVMNANPDEFLTAMIENIKRQSTEAAEANGDEMVFASKKIEVQGVSGYEFSGKIYVDGKLDNISTAREFMVSNNLYLAEHGGPAEGYDRYSGWLDTFQFIDLKTLQNVRAEYLIKKAIDESGILDEKKK